MTNAMLYALHGEALDHALAQRFTVAEEVLEIAGLTIRVVKPANADHLISEADYVQDERLPYWADLWPSARVLAATLLREHGQGKRLLEMGCGLGLDTIAAMHAGFTVTSTDYYEDALHVARANARRNLGREPEIRMVNWREWPEDLGTFDVVMSAWVIETVDSPAIAVTEMLRVLRPGGLVAYSFCSRPVRRGDRWRTGPTRAVVHALFAGHFLRQEQTPFHDCASSRWSSFGRQFPPAAHARACG